MREPMQLSHHSHLSMLPSSVEAPGQTQLRARVEYRILSMLSTTSL